MNSVPCDEELRESGVVPGTGNIMLALARPVGFCG